MKKRTDDVDFIIRYEGEGDVSSKEERAWFQKKVNDGSIWQFQGSYGRRAQELLNEGEIDYPKKKTHDVYGNPIPTQADIKKKFGKYEPASKRRKLREMS